jgi:aerobic-type carbon monoxide dehydrogenase small subunit (CoxS/CutS family)
MADKIERAGNSEESTQLIRLTVNGELYELTTGDDVEPRGALSYDVYPWDRLVHTLRENLGLTGTKLSCDRGACGACSVLVDGKLALSCLLLTVDCDGKTITTIEGLADPSDGELHPIQEAFMENHGAQCGFCTPGMIMATKALLEGNSDPTEEDVKWALGGNICRCGNYRSISKSVLAAAEKMRAERTK